MKKKKILNFILAFIMSLLIICANTSYAINPEDYKIRPDDTLAPGLGKVIGFIQIIGMVLAVAYAMIMGIKYMLSSTDEKASIKKRMIPYVIGAVIFFGATTILRFIDIFASWIK